MLVAFGALDTFLIAGRSVIASPALAVANSPSPDSKPRAFGPAAPQAKQTAPQAKQTAPQAEAPSNKETATNSSRFFCSNNSAKA